MTAKLRAAGWYRAVLFIVLGIAFSFAVTIGSRALLGYDPVVDGEAILQIALLVTPLFFFVGPRRVRLLVLLGGGPPDAARRTTPATARRRWQDYFRVNTDHKVIGIQYTVTSFFFLFVGGLMAMLMRAELAKPGRQFVDANTFNGLFSRPRVDPDLPVHHPGVRRAGELRPAADDRRAGHGVPAAERAVVLDAAGRRHDDAAVVLRARRVVRDGLDGLRAAVGRPRRSGRCSSRSACSSRARRRSRPR